MAGNIEGTTSLSSLSLTGNMLLASNVSSSGTVGANSVWVSTLSVGGFSQPTMSSTSSLVAPFVVQGSASSFTIVLWAAANPGDHIIVSPVIGATVSSLSSGLVAHSHCTLAGQVEFRLSNVSTL